MSKIEETFKQVIKVMTSSDSGTYCVKVGTTEDGTDIYVVFGYETGYEEGEPYQVKEYGKVYTLCGKVAYNCDDLQCDYDWDWYMPSCKNGEVYDTDTAIQDVETYRWLYNTALEVIELWNKGVLTK